MIKRLKRIAVDKVFSQDPGAAFRRKLIAKEAAIGGQLFGEVPVGHRRDFFYLGNHTWVWHETVYDEVGRPNILTTRYEIQGDKIIKAQDGRSYEVVGVDEARNLLAAARAYAQAIRGQVYGIA